MTLGLLKAILGFWVSKGAENREVQQQNF